MSEKIVKIGYWASTGIISAMMLLGGIMTFVNYDHKVEEYHTELGFPMFIIVPLGILKILGAIAITTRINKTITGLAYAGFFFDFVMALGAHISVQDGEYVGPFMHIVLISVSYFFYQKKTELKSS